jgi:hypothetical protein
MKSNQKTKGTPKQDAKRRPETIEERVRRHISDVNSKITDDDIRSVKTELDIRRSGPIPPQKENKADKKQKRNSGKNKEKDNKTGQEKHTTPWNLLSEGYE